MKVAILVVVAFLFYITIPSTAHAANCWWEHGIVMVLPGYVWDDGQCLSDYEFRERHHPQREWYDERHHGHEHWRPEWNPEK